MVLQGLLDDSGQQTGHPADALRHLVLLRNVPNDQGGGVANVPILCEAEHEAVPRGGQEAAYVRRLLQRTHVAPAVAAPQSICYLLQEGAVLGGQLSRRLTIQVLLEAVAIDLEPAAANWASGLTPPAARLDPLLQAAGVEVVVHASFAIAAHGSSTRLYVLEADGALADLLLGLDRHSLGGSHGPGGCAAAAAAAAAAADTDAATAPASGATEPLVHSQCAGCIGPTLQHCI
mmetsp:Transcript_42554/g.118502  ORF Transcript_42554/g.118502 Transcript_42554/m.118502 type:complete len:233 (+) Transcript_42554:179-877(+)